MAAAALVCTFLLGPLHLVRAAERRVPAATSGTTSRAQLRVLVVHQQILQPDVLALAQEAASGIYTLAGVTTTWMAAPASIPGEEIDCAIVFVSREKMPRLAAASGVTNDGVLGFAVMDETANRGRVAYVFPGRIENYAAARHVSFADLLGTVLAHEIGHLLLGIGSHTDTGIMRPHPNVIATLRAHFSPTQAEEIRQVLAAN
jgi:hypothetical protein